MKHIRKNIGKSEGFTTCYHPDLTESAIIAFVLFTLAGGLLSAAFMTLFPWKNGYNELLFASGYIISYVPALLYITAKNRYKAGRETAVREKFSDTQGGRYGKAVLYILSGIMAICMLFLTDLAGRNIEMPKKLEDTFTMVLSGGVISFIAIAVLPAILEEFICRGVILRGMLHHYGERKAILFSAAIFALMHLNLAQAIPAFLTGCLMGWIYTKSRSLTATMLMHFINNGTSFLIGKYMLETGKNPENFSDLIGNGTNSIILYIFIFLIFAICCFLTGKDYEKTSYKTEDEQTISA